MTDQPPPLPRQQSQPPSVPVMPIGYRGHGGSDAPRERPLRMLWGFLAGSGISTLAWVGGWQPLVANDSGAALWIVPAVKFLAAVVFLFVPGWRLFGAGLLVSIAMGFLIFFVTCLAHL